MAAATPVATDCDRFSANLGALNRYSPRAAERVEAAGVPANVQPAVARDGSPTFRVGDDDTQWHYLGRTSMPTVRATALADAFAPDGANVLIPAIGNGYEVKEILSRTPGLGAVFVHDRNWPDVRLALTLHDFAQALNAGRLVILVGDDLEESLSAFFSEFPVFEFPRRMFAPPYLRDADIELLRAAVQRGVTRVADMQADRIAAYSAQLRRAPSAVFVRRLALVTIDARSTVMEAARALHAAAGRSGVDMMDCVPDRPDRCHALARMGALAAADAAMLLNCGWGALREHVPADYPAVAWLLPETRILRGMTDAFGDRQLVFAATPEIERQAIQFGAAPENTRVLDIAVDEETFRPIESHAGNASIEFDVACVADLPDVRAPALNIELDTHIRLWEYICRVAAGRVEMPAETILDAAQSGSGVAIREEHLRTRFLSLIRERLLPMLHTRIFVESLLASGVGVRAFGTGWERSRVPAGRVSSAPTSPIERNQVYNRARTVGCPAFGEATVQTCLEAVMSGACVVYRAPGDPIESLRPGLADVLPHVPHSGELGTLIRRIGFLSGNAEARASACRHARDIIADRHLWTHRLSAVVRALADRRVAP